MLTDLDVAARILRLPKHRQAEALLHFKRLRAQQAHDRPGARSQATRDPKQRARYAGDPHAYFADVFGWTLTPQQEEALDLIERHTRVLLPSANNAGKTFLLAGYGIYRFDAVAALPDDFNGLAEQGARVLLPGPDHDTIFATIYSEMLTHAARAEARGHLMPGVRSDRSVLWRVRAKWDMEAMSPPRKVGQNVAHTASGRHHRNQIALIEEGQGVEEPLWRAAEGMCSSEGNKIVSSFNPTEAIGPAFQRARTGAYVVFHLSAFDHPNVVERRPVFPDAVSVSVTDARVRTDCRDRGPYPETPLDPDYLDFAYALPPAGQPVTPGQRADGVLGDVAGEPRVYRPSPAFTSQVLGQWPTDNEGGLFSTATLDRAMARWREREEPDSAPDRVGVDPAREGGDDTDAAPAWGPTAGELLRSYLEAEGQGPEAVQVLQRDRRTYVGEIQTIPKGDGPDTALDLARRFPSSPFVSDAGAVGTSPNDHLRRMLKRDVTMVSFGAAPVHPVAGEPWSENVRTQMYVRAAMCVTRGLVDVPDDPLLREELLAHSVEYTYRSAEVTEKAKDGSTRRVKKKVPSVALIAKDDVKKMIGRSPDRADAFVLSLHVEAVRPRSTNTATASFAYPSY